MADNDNTVRDAGPFGPGGPVAPAQAVPPVAPAQAVPPVAPAAGGAYAAGTTPAVGGYAGAGPAAPAVGGSYAAGAPAVGGSYAAGAPAVGGAYAGAGPAAPAVGGAYAGSGYASASYPPHASPTPNANAPSPGAYVSAPAAPGTVPAAKPPPPSTFQEVRELAKDFIKRNEKLMWWGHTAYALALGAFVATFAQKGFERARLLALSLTLAWVLVVFFFRFFGTGTQQDFMTAWPGARRRFFIMSYLMKNLFQSMLFFLLPFYWKSSSYVAGTYPVFVGLAACAVLSTLDVVFDGVLLRFKLVASFFFALTLFGCANLVIPALMPNTPIIMTLLIAGGLALSTLVLFHVSLDRLRRPIALGAFAAFVTIGLLGLYSARAIVPPVPVHLVEAGVGTSLRADGKLDAEIVVIRATSLTETSELFSVAEVSVVGDREQFRHVWRKGGTVLQHQAAGAAPAQQAGQVRVASKVPVQDLPADKLGIYTVDVITANEQVVGRTQFEIRE